MPTTQVDEGCDGCRPTWRVDQAVTSIELQKGGIVGA